MNHKKTKACKKSLTVADRGQKKVRWPRIALLILATGSTLAAYQVATYFGQASFFGLKAIEVDGCSGSTERPCVPLAASRPVPTFCHRLG